jgi:anion-transporting  ArsA/GET3 family ATPase
LINDIAVSLPETQLAISSFNAKNYKLDSLSTTNLLLNKDAQILKVGDFKNQTQAQAYYELIQENTTTQVIFKNQDIIPMVISEDNFGELLRARNINDYIEYFNKIYLLN